MRTHGEQIKGHHLRREIIATVATNAIINQAGCTLLVQLGKETTQPMDELVVRYFLCDELIGGRELRAAIHACDYAMPAAEQYAALLAVEEVNRSLLRWWLWNDRTWKLAADDVAAIKVGFDAAADALLAALDGPTKLAAVAREQELVARGFTPELAERLTRVAVLGRGFAVLAAGRDTGLSLAAVARLFQRVGHELHVDSFDDLLALQVPGNSWERRFLSSVEREASAIRQVAVAKMAADDGYVERHKDRIAAIADSLRMVKQFGGHGLVPMYLILEDYRVAW